MTIWLTLIVDIVLIGLVTAGLVQAGRLISHLTELRQSRADMERFVHEFNATVLRAEAGIKGLRQGARESGDDLEDLVGKATLIRDELQFIVESADQIASRLSQSAATAVRAPETMPEARRETKQTSTIGAKEESPISLAGKKALASSASRAEKELMQVLEKLG